MKNGFWYFLNLGRITMIARIAVFPLFLCVWYIQWFSPLYPISCILFGVSIVLSLIPAPSDKTMNEIIDEFVPDLKKRLLDRCKAPNGDAIIVSGYEKSGTMRLRRTRGNELVYPKLAGIACFQSKDKCVLMIAKKSLLSSELARYQEIECNPNTQISIKSSVIDEDENILEVTLSMDNQEEQTTLWVKADFHYRDLLNAIQPFLKK